MPQPGRVVEIVGDIHGRMDLLAALAPPEPGASRVLVGDYVDRGPDSRAVLEFVRARARDDGWIALKGNHEAMFLDFLEHPEKGARWLRYGGVQTLESFGIHGLSEESGAEAMRQAAGRVRDRMDFDLVGWLRELPAICTFGSLSIVHAGLDPFLPPDAQSARAAVWGHPDFGRLRRPDGQWVAHGHTIVKKPLARDGVISLDTGAYATGRLTMARVAPEGDVSFTTVTALVG